MQLTYLQDPGHGWIACPLPLAHDLGIAAQVSRYSYLDGDTLWLEEDCDAALLVDALRARGEPVSFREIHVNHDAYVRAMPRWRAK
jgi:hypothetical protein